MASGGERVRAEKMKEQWNSEASSWYDLDTSPIPRSAKADVGFFFDPIREAHARR